MLNVKQFRELVVRPTLERMSRNGVINNARAAEDLVVGTAVVESNLEYLKQIKGPALSVFQIEPATARWLLDDLSRGVDNSSGGMRLLNFNLAVGFPPSASWLGVPDDVVASKLVTNLAFACALCRLRYYKAKPPLPADGDIDALGQYWKDHYNTYLGAGKAQKFVDRYKRKCL